MIGSLMDRGVLQAAAVFLVVGWLLIQVADAVVPILGLPDWTTPFVTYVVIVGFPVFRLSCCLLGSLSLQKAGFIWIAVKILRRRQSGLRKAT